MEQLSLSLCALRSSPLACLVALCLLKGGCCCPFAQGLYWSSPRQGTCLWDQSAAAPRWCPWGTAVLPASPPAQHHRCCLSHDSARSRGKRLEDSRMAGWFAFALRCLQKIQGGCLALLGVGWEGVLAGRGSWLVLYF